MRVREGVKRFSRLQFYSTRQTAYSFDSECLPGAERGPEDYSLPVLTLNLGSGDSGPDPRKVTGPTGWESLRDYAVVMSSHYHW